MPAHPTSCVPVEVLRCAYCDNRVSVGECREDTNPASRVSSCSIYAPVAPPVHLLVRVLELRADGHVRSIVCEFNFPVMCVEGAKEPGGKNGVECRVC